MVDYIFQYDLEKNKTTDEDMFGTFAIKYYNTPNGKGVEIGNGYRYILQLEARYWNRILRIIRDGELDLEGIRAITRGLMRECLPEEYENTLIEAIKFEHIKEV